MTTRSNVPAMVPHCSSLSTSARSSRVAWEFCFGAPIGPPGNRTWASKAQPGSSPINRPIPTVDASFCRLPAKTSDMNDRDTGSGDAGRGDLDLSVVSPMKTQQHRV